MDLNRAEKTYSAAVVNTAKQPEPNEPSPAKRARLSGGSIDAAAPPVNVPAMISGHQFLYTIDIGDKKISIVCPNGALTLDDGTFQMKQPARDLLKHLGSKRAQVIGWRVMWAMVTQQGAKMFGESYSKSTEFNTWSAPVVLRTEVPLIPVGESKCDWVDSEENRHRQEFCNHIEDYGSGCSCTDPGPLVFSPEPVRIL